MLNFHHRFKRNACLLLIIAFLFTAFSIARAEEYETTGKFLEALITAATAQDQQRLIELVEKNPKIARKTFTNLLNAIQMSLEEGKTLEDRKVKLADGICRLIAVIFHKKLNDPSLVRKYRQFRTQLKEGEQEKVEEEEETDQESGTSSGRETASNKFDRELDYLEKKFAGGKFNEDDSRRFHKLLDELKAKKDYPRLIRAGEIAARLSDNVGMFEKSIEVRKKILNQYAPKVNDPGVMIRSYLLLANSYYLDNQYNESLKYFKKSMEYCKDRTSDMARLGRFIALLNIADIYRLKTDTANFSKTLKEVGSRSEEFDRISKDFQYDPQDFFLLMTSIERMGNIFRYSANQLSKKGQKDKAMQFYNIAVELYQTLYQSLEEGDHFLKNQQDVARAYMTVLLGLALTYRDMGNLNKAVSYFTRLGNALEQFPRDKMVLEDKKLMAMVMLEIGRTYHMAAAIIKKSGTPAQMKKIIQVTSRAYDKANVAMFKILDNVGLIQGLEGKAKFYIDFADLSKPENRKAVEDSLAQAYKYSTRTINYTPGVIRYYILKGRYNEKIGNLQVSRDSYLKALDELEKFVAITAQSARERENLLKEIEPLYKKTAQVLIKNGENQLAFETLQRMKASQIVNSIDISQVRARDPRVKKALGNLHQLRSKTSRVETDLLREKQKPEQFRDPNKIKSLSKTLAATKSEFFKNVNVIRNSNPDYERLVAVKPAGFAKIQKLLPDNAILVQYFPSTDRIYIFLVTRNSFKIKTVAAPREKVNQLVRQFRSSMDREVNRISRGEAPEAIENFNQINDANTRKSLESLTQLHQLLIEPIREEIASAEVVAVIPTGLLYYLPFQALAQKTGDGYRFFIQEKQVVYLSSADLFEVVQGKAKGDPARGLVVAFGNPDNSLKSATAEVEYLKRVFPKSKVYIGDQATEKKVKNVSPDLKILHLATHGYLDSADVNQSYIQLAGSGEDSKLRQGEIFEIPLQNADLVTLSACRTALGEESPGSEIASLASAFSIAGAPTILASLWPVYDESTAILMNEFYTQLASGKTKSEAIQAAQVKLLSTSRYSHPFYWAPFIMIGDWRHK